ncbi:zinc finger protein 157 isoform X2 [Ooceraea biroi]|uniref:zinc finger protein 157 isoform X2 n=1 Tax=Ooceraea biroi TaxID=2015173 RepID=UPI0009716D99|nr:zinc finger protein 157 isoform X2 [Ooceraea biroi]
MESRNSSMLESSREENVLSYETVKSTVTRDDRSELETEEGFLLVSQAQQERYAEEENVDEATLKERTAALAFINLCRICANANDHLIPIFEGDGVERNLAQKILKHLPIRISEDDSLPLQLCYHCATTLLAWHELSEGCLNAERKLLGMQGKQEYDTPAMSLDNLEVPAPITTMETTVNIANSEASEPDQQADDKTEARGTEETDESNRCGPGRAFAARITALRPSNVAIEHESDVAGGLTAIVGSTTENSERETQDSSDDVRYDERTDSNASQREEETRATISRSADKLLKNYTCDSCQRAFKRKYHLIRHIAACKPNSTNEKNASKRTRTMKRRRKNGNLTKRREDSDCRTEDAGIASDDGDRRRVAPTRSPRRKRSATYPCAYCEHVAEKRKLLNAHVTEAHPELAKRSRKSFVATDTVTRARIEHDGRVYYHCAECGKNLNSPYTFYWHVRIHTGERTFTCHLCGKRFRVNQGLARHLRETHDGIKNVACDLCGRMFSTRRNVEDHRRIHTGERPYVCNVCGKTFKQKASLFVHNRTHTDVFPHKCGHCGQAFRTRPPLVLHITKHTGEKPHACDVCGRRFRIKYELKRHRLIHSDEKPWCCTDCGLSFRQKRYLVNHRRLNHESPRCSTAAQVAAK